EAQRPAQVRRLVRRGGGRFAVAFLVRAAYLFEVGEVGFEFRVTLDDGLDGRRRVEDRLRQADRLHALFRPPLVVGRLLPGAVGGTQEAPEDHLSLFADLVEGRPGHGIPLPLFPFPSQDLARNSRLARSLRMPSVSPFFGFAVAMSSAVSPVNASSR